jgi:hypothetical protein
LNPELSLQDLLTYKTKSGVIMAPDIPPVTSKQLRKQLEDLSAYQNKIDQIPLPGEGGICLVKDLLKESE